MASGRGRNPNWKRNRKRRSKASFPGKNVPKCPYCGQNVRDILTAIAIENDEAPTHFDCVIKKISEEESLQPKEKVCYLGNGSFGIVYFKNPSDPRQFTIKKRIQVEAEKKEIEWRTTVSNRALSR